MTFIALQLSAYVNGVTRRARRRCPRSMFPGYPISSITNGVHSATWTSEPFQRLFDRRIPDWRRDSFSLRYALSVPSSEIAAAHRDAKRTLIEEVERAYERRPAQWTNLTLGFARQRGRRTAPRSCCAIRTASAPIAREHGTIQIVYFGKAHPQAWREGDHPGDPPLAAGAARRGEGGLSHNYDMEPACSSRPAWTCGSTIPGRRTRPPARAA